MAGWAAWSAVRLKGVVLVEVPKTLNCMTVRVLGPYPGGVEGAPPVGVLSGSPVK